MTKLLHLAGAIAFVVGAWAYAGPGAAVAALVLVSVPLALHLVPVRDVEPAKRWEPPFNLVDRRRSRTPQRRAADDRITTGEVSAFLLKLRQAPTAAEPTYQRRRGDRP